LGTRLAGKCREDSSLPLRAVFFIHLSILTGKEHVFRPFLCLEQDGGWRGGGGFSQIQEKAGSSYVQGGRETAAPVP